MGVKASLKHTITRQQCLLFIWHMHDVIYVSSDVCVGVCNVLFSSVFQEEGRGQGFTEGSYQGQQLFRCEDECGVLLHWTKLELWEDELERFDARRILTRKWKAKTATRDQLSSAGADTGRPGTGHCYFLWLAAWQWESWILRWCWYGKWIRWLRWITVLRKLRLTCLCMLNIKIFSKQYICSSRSDILEGAI